MGFSFIQLLILLLPISYLVNCAPSHERTFGRRTLNEYHESLMTKESTITMPSIKWNNFGVTTKNPLFDTYQVTATGLRAEIALAVDKKDGIYVADHLERQRDKSPTDHISALITRFITNGGGRPNMRFLAVTNIAEPDTKEVLSQFKSDGAWQPGPSKEWKAISSTKIGKIGLELGAPLAIYIGDILKAKNHMGEEGPTMVFIYDKSVNLGLFTPGRIVGKPAEQMTIGRAGLHSTAEMAKHAEERKKKTKQLKQSQQSNQAITQAPGQRKKKGNKGCCVILRV